MQEKFRGRYVDERIQACACGCGKPLSIYEDQNKGLFLAKHFVKYWQRVWKGVEGPVGLARPHRPRIPFSRVLRYQTRKGYWMYRCPSHPSTKAHGFILEHRLLAERALGRTLDIRHPVHHANGVKSDNGRGNLVICEDEAYHARLHQRSGLRFWGDNHTKGERAV